MTNKLYF